jgi:multicomponent Na+:H+ antiporter subunit B
VILEEEFLTSLWLYPDVGIGTPLLFDLGVFLVVIGVVTTITFTLAEE